MAKKKIKANSSRASIQDIMNTEASTFDGPTFEEINSDLDNKLKRRTVFDSEESKQEENMDRGKEETKFEGENTKERSPVSEVERKEGIESEVQLENNNQDVVLSKTIKELKRLYALKDPKGKSVSFNFTMSEDVMTKLNKLGGLYSVRTDDYAPRKHHLMRKLVEDWVSKNFEKMLNELS